MAYFAFAPRDKIVPVLFVLFALLIIKEATCKLPVGRSSDHVMTEDDSNHDEQFSNCKPDGQLGPILGFEQQDHMISSIMQQSWMPAYPGSGSGLIGLLIENATGYNRSSTSSYCGNERCIVCKTHFPAVGKVSPDDTEPVVEIPFSEKYFMLIRNPSGAIPSYYNQIHEMRTDVESHTEQAPVNDWRIWRDESFHRMMHEWTEIIRYWDIITHYDLAMYIPYEELTEPSTGPGLFRELLDNLWILHQQGEPKDFRDAKHNAADQVACLWKTFVIDNASVKRSRSYEPGFTWEQKDHMLHVLSDLIEWALDKVDEESKMNRRLIEILEGYRESIFHDLIIDSGE